MPPTNVTLSDGRLLSIDLNKITVKEFRQLVDPSTEKADEDALIARACGIEPDEIPGMGYVDYTRLVRAVIDAARDPLGADTKN